MTTDMTVMSVAWETHNPTTAIPEVQWGLDPESLNNTAQGASTNFDTSNVSYVVHQAQMYSLLPYKYYAYRVGDPSGWSKVFYFHTVPDATAVEQNASQTPQLHLLFGDLGASYGYSLCRDCNGSTVCECTDHSVGLVSEVGKADMILHTGDFAYDFNSDNSKVGEQFMQNIEQVASSIPYMVSIGNHENSGLNLAHYTERFRHMPSGPGRVHTENGPAPNNWWFSWDAGLVHYVSISTEAYFDSLMTLRLGEMFTWLKKDLKAANKNRANVPWILVNGHRSVYCSCDKDCDAGATILRDGLLGLYSLEKLFHEEGVDLFVNGHEHNYERNWPTYKNKTSQSNTNPSATIYIVTGAAGSHELHEPFTRPQPARSAFRFVRSNVV
jgi:hypothetical protein